MKAGWPTRCSKLTGRSLVLPFTQILVRAAALAALSGGAVAQMQRTEVSVRTNVAATDNGNGAAAGFEQSDVLLSVHPRLDYFREGAGLRVNAGLDAEFLGSAKGSRDSRVLPGAHVDANAVVVERLLSIDGLADVRQTEADPFGVRAADGSTLNTRTVGNLRLSPVLRYEPTARTELLARYDVARTNVLDTIEGDAATNASLVRISVKPRPLGLALEWNRDDSDYADGTLQGKLLDNRVSAIASAVLADEWIVGVAAGRERSKLGGIEETGTTYGARLLWVPGPRTEMAASVDHRFFGTGWSLSARHRTPRMSFVLHALREPVTALNAAVASNGLGSFLDAILTTRNPDPAQRLGMVDNLLASRGLETTIQGPSLTTAIYPQLRTAAELTWVYLGVRTAVTLSAYSQDLRQLTLADGSTGSAALTTNDNRQRGAGAGWNYRLDPLLSLNLSANLSQTDGLAQRLGERTREAALAAAITQQLTPKSNLAAGVRVRRVRTNATGLNPFNEDVIFVGLGHRF